MNKIDCIFLNKNNRCNGLGQEMQGIFGRKKCYLKRIFIKRRICAGQTFQEPPERKNDKGE